MKSFVLQLGFELQFLRVLHIKGFTNHPYFVTTRRLFWEVQWIKLRSNSLKRTVLDSFEESNLHVNLVNFWIFSIFRFHQFFFFQCKSITVDNENSFENIIFSRTFEFFIPLTILLLFVPLSPWIHMFLLISNQQHPFRLIMSEFTNQQVTIEFSLEPLPFSTYWT